jgi:hypothetical protein
MGALQEHTGKGVPAPCICVAFPSLPHNTTQKERIYE